MSASVAAIVVAAGESRRMGCCKQLLDLEGKTALARCLETLRAGGVREIVVVVGLQGGAVAVEAGRFQVRIVVNEDPAGDMASSVQVGQRSLTTEVSGVIVALCDYPLVTPATIAALAAAHEESPALILIPVHGGRRGHPTLFPLEILAETAAGETLRDLVRRSPERVRMIEVHDPGILLDMDTPEDYQRMLQKLRSLALQV